MANAGRFSALWSLSRTLVAVAVTLGFPARAAHGQPLEWAKQGGGPNFDQGLAIDTDASGNSCVTGFFTGTATFGAGGAHETTLEAGLRDIYVAKYDAAGGLLWAKQARNGDTAVGQANGVSIDGAGNCYVTGVFRFGMVFEDGTTLTEFIPGAGDGFVAKYDTNGVFKWARQPGPDFLPGISTGGAYEAGIATDPSGNSYVSGGSADARGQGLIVVTKYDTDGTKQWVAHAGGGAITPGGGISFAVAADTAGNSYVTGYFSGAAVFGPGEANESTLTGEFSNNVFVAKYDTAGRLVWARQAIGSGVGSGIGANASGAVVITGDFGSLTFGSGEPNETTLPGGRPINAFIAKFDAAGSLLWARQGNGTAQGLAAAVDSDGNAHITGSFGGPLTFGAGEANETFLRSTATFGDMFVATYDSGGALAWARQTVGPSLAQGNGVGVDAAGATYVVGTFGETDGGAGAPITVTFGLGEANETAITTAIGSGTEMFVAKFAGGPTRVNHPPVAIDQTVATPEDTPLDIVLSATDLDGDALTFSVVSGPSHGTLSGAGASLIYTPNANYNGPDSFTFRVSDGTAVSAVDGRVDITVSPVNDAPVAQGEAVSTPENVSVDITLHATDVDNDPLTYSIVDQPVHGTLTGAPPTVRYTPQQGYAGADSFTFRAHDGAVFSAPALVTLSVERGRLACGALVSGVIGAVGEVDTYTFVGQAGQIIAVAIASTAGFATGPSQSSAGLGVVAPSGAIVVASLRSNSQGTVTLRETGTYTLRVSAVNRRTTGSYNISLHCMLPAPVGAPLLRCGTLQSGTIAVPGELDLYWFAGQSGQIVSLAVASTGGFATGPSNSSAGLTLFAPSGAVLGTLRSNSQATFTLPATGAYAVRVSAVNLATTGSYNVSLQCLLPPTPGAPVLQCGALQSGTIAAPGKVDVYAFTGQSGQIVSVAVASTGGFATGPSNSSAGLTLFAPSGAVLGTLRSNSQATFTLPATGTYAVRVSAVNLATTGSYNVSLQCLLPPTPGAPMLQCGALQSGTIAAAGKVDVYAFTGQPGQMVSLAVASTGGFATGPSNSSAGLTLFAPSGAVLGTLRSNSQATFTLPATGTYAVRVSAANLATVGQYALRLMCPS